MIPEKKKKSLCSFGLVKTTFRIKGDSNMDFHISNSMPFT